MNTDRISRLRAGISAKERELAALRCELETALVDLGKQIAGQAGVDYGGKTDLVLSALYREGPGTAREIAVRCGACDSETINRWSATVRSMKKRGFIFRVGTKGKAAIFGLKAHVMGVDQ